MLGAPLVDSMRAVRLHKYSEVDSFQVEEVPRPRLKPKDVLIEVHASSVNPIDWKIASGSQKAVIRYQLPWILGRDVSGVVREVGSAVTSFKPGDEVYSVTDYRRPGCYAEYTAVRESEVSKKPQSIDHQQAAGLPLVALTAYQSLISAADLKKGEKVLIQAGAGGVGSFAIQLAKHLGAHVTTTCSARNIDFVKSLGADEIIDYKEHYFADVVEEQDVVLDCLGGKAKFDALKVLKRGGRHVSVVTDMPELTAKYGSYLGVLMVALRLGRFWLTSRLKHSVKPSVVVMRTNGQQLSEVADWIDQGTIKPLVDTVFGLENLDQAFAQSRTKRARGKIIVSVRNIQKIGA